MRSRTPEDTFERVLDKGVAIESSLRTTRGGIGLHDAHARARVVAKDVWSQWRGEPKQPSRVVSASDVEGALELADRVVGLRSRRWR